MKAKIKSVVLALTIGIFLSGVTMPVLAEDKPADTMQLVKDKIKADKKLFVAENMQLTEKDGKGFWPVYESYQKDLGKHNEKLIKLIEDYAQNYETMTDQKAQAMTKDYLALETARVKLLQSYVPKFSKVLGDKKTARYLQLENKISAVLKFELAANIPLVK
jgi:G:T/U-mismatch repair DNA glycosylase